MNSIHVPSVLPEFAASTLGIYLDHHSTTPVDPRVAKVVLRAMIDDFGNANSVDHKYGEVAHALVENAREAVAGLVGAQPDDIYFTSGSTEAIRLAISHAIGSAPGQPLKIVLTRTEHPAILDAVARAERLGLAQLTWIDVRDDATIDMDGLRHALNLGVDLLCVMAANNEVGTVYPIADIFELADACGTQMLVDATQAAGSLSFDLRETPFEYLVLSAHKIYGPKGVGALISPVYDPADVYGLGAVHEATPNVPGIAGLGEACRLLRKEGAEEALRMAALRDHMQARLTNLLPDLVVNGSQSARLAHNLHISIPGVPNDLVVQRLRGRVAISTGAACMSGALSASHVLKAMGLSRDLQDGALRIGLGRFTNRQDVEQAANEIAAAIQDLKSAFKGQSDD